MFKLTMETTTAGFPDVPGSDLAEVTCILRRFVIELERDGARRGKIHDFNGTVVGEWSFENETG